MVAKTIKDNTKLPAIVTHIKYLKSTSAQNLCVFSLNIKPISYLLKHLS